MLGKRKQIIYSLSEKDFAAQFVRHVSINFMMMTFYLEITATTLLIGTLLVAVLGCGAAAFPVKRMLVNRMKNSTIRESKG